MEALDFVKGYKNNKLAESLVSFLLANRSIPVDKQAEIIQLIRYFQNLHYVTVFSTFGTPELVNNAQFINYLAGSLNSEDWSMSRAVEETLIQLGKST